MVVLLGAGQSASPPFDVEPFVSGELAHLEHKLQHHREGTMQFLRMRGAGNPPPRSSAPPRPPDPTDLRRRLLIEKEETLRMVREKESEFRLELDKTLALFKCEMDKVMQNVLDQFRLGRTSQLTPPPNPAQPPKEHSSTPLSDSETAIPIVHSHLWKARCKEVARTTMGATGGVKKPHISRLGASTLHKTSKYRKLNFRSLAASLLFDDAISAQSNHNPTSFRVVSDTGTSVPNLNFVSIDCDGIDSVFVAKLNGSDESLEIGKEESSDKRAQVYSGDVKELSEFEGVSVQQDGLQGPNLGENGRKCHALHLLDEMQYSDGLCNVGKHIVGYMGIRDKGGGLATHCLIVDEYFEFPDNKTTTAHLDCKLFVVSKHLCSKYKMARALAPSEAFTGVHGIVELDKVVVTMKKGEIALVIIFSENAVGALEAQPKWIMVPPNSTLCYASELVSVIVVKDQKIEVDGTEHEESNSHTINIKVGFDDRRTFYSACIGVQVHVEDVTTIASICFDLKDGAKIYKKLIMMAGIAYEFEKNFATIQEVIVASRNINLLAACVKSDDMKSGCQLWDNISVISCSRVTSWNPVRSCYFQNENHMEVHNALEAEISDIGNGFPLVLAPDIQDNKGEGGFIVNNQDVRAAVGVLDDGLMIMEADIADEDKKLSISFFWNMCVYLLLPVLVKQPTLAASVTESLAYHINHQMEDKTVVHALLYEEGFNIEFFEKPKDITLEVLIESLQTHDDCVAVLEGLKDKSIDSELVGVIRDSWILKPKSVSVTWDWSRLLKKT